MQPSNSSPDKTEKKQNEKGSQNEPKDQSSITYYRPEKLQKMIRISLAILQVVKKRAEECV